VRRETRVRYVKTIIEEWHKYRCKCQRKLNAQSKLDFINKLNIALKESNETEYWLELLFETEFLDKNTFDSIIKDNNNITGTLVNIIKSTKQNININPD
jgi:hypothetical protein